MLTKAMTAEWSRYNIQCNAVADHHPHADGRTCGANPPKAILKATYPLGVSASL